jgi:hypothetical protein
MATILMLHQIYYHPDQLPKLFPFAQPYFNSHLSLFFENECIESIVTRTTSKNIGVCSWKLADKMRTRVGYRGVLTEEAVNGDFEVLSLTKNSSRHTMIAMANQWHKGFVPALDLLWQKLGYKRPGEAKNPIYQNAWIGRTDIYKRYVAEFLSPAMNLTMKDEELYKLMTQPSGYGRLSKSSDLTNVKAHLGMDDYPLSPFVLERCPSLWIDMHKIKVTYL